MLFVYVLYSALITVSICTRLPLGQGKKRGKYKTKGRQISSLPHVDEVATMSIKQLLAKRPYNMRSTRKDEFVRLFAAHPRIARLSLDTMTEEEFIQGWADLLRTEREAKHSKKLTTSMRYHLDHDLKVDKRIRREIQRRFNVKKMGNYQRSRVAKMKLATDDPEMVEKRKRYLETRSKNNKKAYSKRNFQVESSERFENLLLTHEIIRPDNMLSSISPIEIEKMTREYREELDGALMTTLCLKNYLQSKSTAMEDLEQAMENRRAFNAMLGKQRWKEKKKKKKSKNSVDVFDKMAGPESIGKPPPSSSIQDILHQVDWWAPPLLSSSSSSSSSSQERQTLATDSHEQ